MTTLADRLRHEAAVSAETRPDDSDIPVMLEAADALDALVLAAKDAAVVIAQAAKTVGADPMKGSALPGLMAAIKGAGA